MIVSTRSQLNDYDERYEVSGVRTLSWKPVSTCDNRNEPQYESIADFKQLNNYENMNG